MNIKIKKLGGYRIPWYLTVFRVAGGKFPRYKILMAETSEGGAKITTGVVAYIEKTTDAIKSYWVTLDAYEYSIPKPIDPQTGKDLILDYGKDDKCLWMQIEKYFGVSSILKRSEAWQWLCATYENYNVTTKLDVTELREELISEQHMSESSKSALFSDGSKIVIYSRNDLYRVLLK